MATQHEHWTRVRDRLRAEVGDNVYSSWFARMDLEGIEGETVKLSVPTRFLKSWIASHYTEKVMSLLAGRAARHFARRDHRALGGAAAGAAEGHSRRSPGAGARDRATSTTASKSGSAAAPISAVHEALGGSPLDPRLTFDSFIVGRSNTLAHAAAKQVAQARRGDSVMFNPLYIHAGVGLGKTHLLQSLAWAGNAAAERKVLYLTAEKLHVRLRRRAAGADRDRLQGGAARPSTCW